jgi:hypothetical protein
MNTEAWLPGAAATSTAGGVGVRGMGLTTSSDVTAGGRMSGDGAWRCAFLTIVFLSGMRRRSWGWGGGWCESEERRCSLSLGFLGGAAVRWLGGRRRRRGVRENALSDGAGGLDVAEALLDMGGALIVESDGGSRERVRLCERERYLEPRLQRAARLSCELERWAMGSVETV